MDRKITGANCYNCMYISERTESVEASNLNELGGIDPKVEDEMQTAKAADLKTLPGGSKVDAASKRFCTNLRVGMYVTARMVCIFWDHKGVRRPWLPRNVMPEYLDQIF